MIRRRRRQPRKKKTRYAGVTFTDKVDNSPAGKKAAVIKMAETTGGVPICDDCFEEYYFGVYLETDRQYIVQPDTECVMCGKGKIEICVRKPRSASEG